MQIGKGESSIPYIVEIKQFTGPLDLLLHLVEKAKVDIRDIFVSDITEQYIRYVADMRELDMDSASEFLSMAAWLLEIKSRALLPKTQEQKEEEEDPEQALIRRLEQYRLLKNAAGQLQAREEFALNAMYRLPEEIVVEKKLDLHKLTLEKLLEAYLAVQNRRQARLAPVQPRRIEREEYSVQDCMLHIVTNMRAGKTMTFLELLPARNKNAVISVFLALLELLKLGAVRLRQDTTFGALQVLPGEENHG